jgi:hypothetical protein
VTTPGASVQVGPELFLSRSGALVRRAGQEAPASPTEQGELLLRAATVSEGGANLFANPTLTLEQKQGALKSLAEAFRSPGLTDESQNLQVRSSAAPLLVDLAASLDAQSPEQKALQLEVVKTYVELLGTETHGLARDFMIYDLDRAKGQLATEVRGTIDELMREVAPLAPPYEEWFAGGNTQLKFEYYVGEGFWEEEISDYVRNGFTRTDNPDGTVTLRRHYDAERDLNDGSSEKFQTDVELVMHNGPSGLFDKMSDAKTAGIVYSGHANYGRQVPSRLPAGSAMNGAKLFFGAQCGGKGTHNAILGKYPDLQVVTSKNSSYGFQDRKTMLNMLDGISKRLPWTQISTQNVSRNSDNYYFPSDTLISKRSLDRDGDGKVDAFDRVLNHNTFSTQAPIEEQLTPRDPGHAAAELDGRAIHASVLRFWRMAGYNEWADPLKDQGVLSGGYFAGSATDPLVKLTPDGDVQRLQINSQYAHASEEVLGAAIHYELGKAWAAKSGLSEGDAKAAGLLMATKCLEVDLGSNDREAWDALLAYAQLPAIPFSTAQRALSIDDHSAGDSRTLAELKKALEAAGVTL